VRVRPGGSGGRKKESVGPWKRETKFVREAERRCSRVRRARGMEAEWKGREVEGVRAREQVRVGECGLKTRRRKADWQREPAQQGDGVEDSRACEGKRGRRGEGVKRVGVPGVDERRGDDGVGRRWKKIGEGEWR